MPAFKTSVLGIVVLAGAMIASSSNCKADDDQQCPFCMHWNSSQAACIVDDDCHGPDDRNAGEECQAVITCWCENGESPGATSCAPCSEGGRRVLCKSN
jgi:hypothetical protein